MCGLIGHTDKVCPELFELDADDSVLNWGDDLKLVSQRIGTAATDGESSSKMGESLYFPQMAPLIVPNHKVTDGALNAVV